MNKSLFIMNGPFNIGSKGKESSRKIFFAQRNIALIKQSNMLIISNLYIRHNIANYYYILFTNESALLNELVNDSMTH